jgi:Concanavalin A-like lectin/glucanases superfamily
MPILSAFGAARAIPGSSGVVEGEYSYDFNGSSYFTYPASSSFAIGTQQFSIECFVYLDSYPATSAVILDFGYGTGSSQPQRIQFYINSSGQPAFVRNNYPTTSGSTTATSSIAVSLSTWTYIAVSRLSSGVVRVFVGSSQGASATISGTITSGTGITPSVGNGTVQTTRFLDGKISNLRFNLGSSFSSATVPTSPLTAQATTKMLTCQSSTVKDNSVANGGGPWTVTNSGVIVSGSGPF